MQPISVSESQVYLLRIAKWFDSLCREHQIPYYMLGGTMLGAIRHHGFIPWDDDMDFGVPIEYYDRLRQLLKENPLPYVRVCEFHNCKGCRTAFIKLDDSRTCIEDKCVDLPLEENLGINVDIFPLVTCKKRGFMVARHLFLTNSQDALLRYIWKLTLSFREGDCYGNLFGRYRSKEIIRKDIFGRATPYEFEDTTLLGPEQADAYLKLLYNDYMKLPPADQQTNHSHGIYKR